MIERPQQTKRPSIESGYRIAAYLEDKLPKALEDGPNAYTPAFCLIFGAYLSILDQRPEDELALTRLYRVALLWKTSPPALPEILGRARKHYKERLERDPQDDQACMRICQIDNILHGSENGKGLPWARRALEINPSNSDAHLEIARQHIREEKPDEALRLADRAIELNPNNADAYALKGLVLKTVGGGLIEYRKCFELDPTHLVAKLMQHAVGEATGRMPRRKLWWKFW